MRLGDELRFHLLLCYLPLVTKLLLYLLRYCAICYYANCYCAICCWDSKESIVQLAFFFCTCSYSISTVHSFREDKSFRPKFVGVSPTERGGRASERDASVDERGARSVQSFVDLGEFVTPRLQWVGCCVERVSVASSEINGVIVGIKQFLRSNSCGLFYSKDNDDVERKCPRCLAR